MAKPSKKGAKSEAEVAADAKKKREILDKVAQSNLPTKTILKELGISRSTYYSWLKRYEEEGDEGLLDSRSLAKAEEKVEEPAPAVETAEPRVPEVEPVEEVVEETPPEPVIETIAEVEPAPPVTEEPDVTPEQPVAAPLQEEPEEREQVVMPEEPPPFSGGREKKGMGGYAFVAVFLLVIGLLLTISSSNYNTYKLQKTGNALTLWKGKFAPSGLNMVDSFEPVVVGDTDVTYLTQRKFVGQDAVHKAIFAFFMDQVETEGNLGGQADNGKIDGLLDRAEKVLASGAAGDAGLSGPRFRLAQKRVGIAELSLKEAYEKALPVYEEAARMGLGDAATLDAKIEFMQEALGLVAAEGVAAEAKEAEPEAAPETSEGEAVAPAAAETPDKDVEASITAETPSEQAESEVKSEPSAEESETVEAPAEQETAPEGVEQEEEANKPTGFLEWLRSKNQK
jgi:outer membrane biosynthesis protein TonB